MNRTLRKNSANIGVISKRVLMMPLPISEAEDARVLQALRKKGLDAAREARSRIIAERSVRNPETSEAR